MAKRSTGGRRPSGKRPAGRRPAARQHFPRTVRLNSLLTEIVADYFERTDDDRLGFLTITGVEVDADLNVAQVFVSSLDASGVIVPADAEADAARLGALEEHRKAVQRAIATQTTMRKTPLVQFEFDHGVRHGARVEEILAGLGPLADADAIDDVSDGIDPDVIDAIEDEPGEGEDVGDEHRRDGGA